MSGIAIAVAAGLTAVVLVVAYRVRRPASAPTDIREHILADVPSTAAAVALLERWRERTARWRATLAVPAVLATFGASLVVRQSLDVGIGAHPAWADPLLTGFLSVFVATIAAELHHLRRRPTGPRTAQLAPREVADYLPDGARTRQGVLAVLAVLATVLAVTLGGQRVPTLGLIALAALALVPAIQARIVIRSRPAVSTDLLAADDAVRRLAVRSVDLAGAGAALLLTAWQLAPTYSSIDLPGPLAVVLAAGQLVALAIAILWWRQSNPRRLLPDVPAALAPTPATRAAP